MGKKGKGLKTALPFASWKINDRKYVSISDKIFSC